MRLLTLFTIFMLGIPVASPASEFDWMTREFARESGMQQVRIPFFGLARFAISVAHPAGASDVKLAVFEHPSISADDLARIAESTVGQNWKPIVRVRERGGDAANIYVQPDGKHLRVLIVSLEKQEAVLVQVRIRPEELMKFVERERRNHQA